MRVPHPLGSRGAASDVEHFIDALFVNVSHGRFERSLSGLTAIARAIRSVVAVQPAFSRKPTIISALDAESSRMITPGRPLIFAPS